MKKLLGTLLVTCGLLTSSMSQQNDYLVTGKIIDAQNGKPLGNTSVTLGNQTTQTNDQGIFNFYRIKPGKYSLISSQIGYKNDTTLVQTSLRNTPLAIQLTTSARYLVPLEIVSLRASDLSPFAKSNLNKAEIASNNLGQDIPYILNQTPSAVVNSDAGTGIGYTGIRIRGTDATRINITLNGIPYNDAESQGTFFVNLPDFASSLSSVQIQRGVGTSSNGTGAFGASINLQTNEFIEKPYAEINNSFGSFNTQKNTIKAGTGLINNHFTVDARLSRIVSDGYIDRAFSNLQSFAISAAYVSNKSSIRLNIFSGKEKTYQAWYGISEDILPTNRKYNPYTYPNQTDNYQQNHYQLFFNHQLNSKISLSTAFFFTPGKGYYEEFKEGDALSNYGINSTVTSDLIRQKWLDNKFYGQIFSAQYKSGKTNLIVGGGWSKYEGDHFGDIIWTKAGGVDNNYRYYFNYALKTDQNIYAKWEYQLNKNLLVYTDVQYKHVQHNMDGFDSRPGVLIKKSFDFVNPKLGISYRKNGWLAYASYAVANKEPNRTDFENATNNSPLSEKLQDWEAGIERKSKNYGYSANLFYMDYDNQLVLTGKLNDVGNAIRVNTPKSSRLGIELQGNIAIYKWLHASANLTLSKNKIKKFTEYLYKYDNNYEIIGDTAIEHSNTDISFSPNTIGGLTVEVLPLSYLKFALISKYVGVQYLDNTQNKTRRINDYFTQDARVTLDIKCKAIKEMQLVFQVNNIFNRLYESNGATYPGIYSGTLYNSNYYFPMAGTNFMAALQIKL